MPSHYQQATVCVDANGNGACDPGEPSASTDDDGAFFLPDPGAGGIVAEVSTAATNAGHAVGQRVVFRAPAAQAAEGPMVVSPLSTEVARMMEADVLDYATATAEARDAPRRARRSGDERSERDRRRRASERRC